MGNFMKKFKKLAVLAITIPTILSNTNISFAMIPPFQSIVYDSQQQIYEIINIPLNQLFLDGQGNVLYNPTVPYDDTYGIITIQTALTATNIPNIYIVNGLLHDEYGYIYYANGQPVLLPLQQQSETITQGQYYYDTVDNSPFEIKEQYKQIAYDSQEKSPRPPESTKTGKTGRKRTREYIDCQNCGVEKCARPFGRSYTRKKDGTKMQQYRCKECKKYFTLGKKNGKIVKKVDRTHECVECKKPECKKYGKCAMPNGYPYTRQDGTKMQQYMCTKCRTTFTQPINKNAEE